MAPLAGNVAQRASSAAATCAASADIARRSHHKAVTAHQQVGRGSSTRGKSAVAWFSGSEGSGGGGVAALSSPSRRAAPGRCVASSCFGDAAGEFGGRTPRAAADRRSAHRHLPPPTGLSFSLSRNLALSRQHLSCQTTVLSLEVICIPEYSSTKSLHSCFKVLPAPSPPEVSEKGLTFLRAHAVPRLYICAAGWSAARLSTEARFRGGEGRGRNVLVVRAIADATLPREQVRAPSARCPAVLFTTAAHYLWRPHVPHPPAMGRCKLTSA